MQSTNPFVSSEDACSSSLLRTARLSICAALPEAGTAHSG